MTVAVPPRPITATVEPGSTLAVRNTAPTLVVTAQPIRAARSSGMSSRIFTTACSCASMWSAKDDSASGAGIGTPFRLMRCGRSVGRRVASFGFK
ncbi:MAG TPA: hypothetical protein VF991_14195 [Reyranella sp.]